MKLLKNITLYLFIVLLFCGTVGVRVFEHSCRMDGTSISILVKSEHHCSPEEDQEESCCMEEESPATSDEESGIQSSSCCSDAQYLYSISSAYQIQDESSLKNQFLAPYFKFREVAVCWSVQPLIQKQLKHPLTGPPPLSGFEICIYKQEFRI